jgi:hypothetical protein
MPASDLIHDAVKAALVKDGWTITDDPFLIAFEDVTLYADLAAERTLAARRAERRIVVEIKSFLGPSLYYDWEQALGQYEVYRRLLQVTDPERELFLAVAAPVFHDFFQRKSVQTVVALAQVKMVVIRLDIEEVEQWIPKMTTVS